MAFAILSITKDRKTGKIISKEIQEPEREISKSEVYDPVVEVFYRDFLEWEKSQQEQNNARGR